MPLKQAQDFVHLFVLFTGPDTSPSMLQDMETPAAAISTPSRGQWSHLDNHLQREVVTHIQFMASLSEAGQDVQEVASSAVLLGTC